MVEPFPWAALPRVDRRTSRLAGWLGARLDLGAAPLDLGIEALEVVRAEVLAGHALDARLADPTAGVVRIRRDGIAGFVVVPGLVVRAIAQRALGGPAELGAPRPLTRAEQAVLVAAVAAVVEGSVEGTALGGPEVPGLMNGQAAVLEVRLVGGLAGEIAVVLPLEATLEPAAPAAREAPWLAAEARVAVVIADAAVEPAALAGLRVRDVLVVRPIGPRGEAELRIARGRVRVALARGVERITVLSAYERLPMDPRLAEDYSIALTVAIGDVPMSMKTLLEMRPGEVLGLGKPVGTGVELRLGTQVVAHGELLVDVGGEVGVRVLSLDRPL